MPIIRAVVFDIYKTLIDIETDEESPEAYAFLARWLSYCGIDIDAAGLRYRYLQLCSREMSRVADSFPDFDIGNVFFQILSESTRPDLDRKAKAAEMALLFRMLTTKSISVFPGVHRLLNRLKGKAKLGIVSNAQRLFTIPELDRFDLTGYFDAIVLSSDVGVRKPNSKPFHQVLQRLSVKPEEAIFVGDNLFDDVQGAANVGMKTIWINRQGKVPDTKETKPDYEISGGSYEELTELLESVLRTGSGISGGTAG